MNTSPPPDHDLLRREKRIRRGGLFLFLGIIVWLVISVTSSVVSTLRDGEARDPLVTETTPEAREQAP